MVIERRPKKVIIDSLGKYPAVGLIGCRQAGKTTLAKALQEGLSGRFVKNRKNRTATVSLRKLC